MKRSVLLVLPLIVSTISIIVPVDNIDTSQYNVPDNDSGHNQTQNKPLYYTSDEAVDSYLIPLDPHRPHDVLPESVVTPATYLLPPSEGKHAEYYYAPAESDDQSEWYPIAQQSPQNEQIQLLPPKPHAGIIPISVVRGNQSQALFVQDNPRTGKLLGERYHIPIPSLKLEPPAEDAPNDYKIKIPSDELELPAEEIDHPYQPIQGNSNEVKHQPIPYRAPSKIYLRKYKNPTKLYPKKFNSGGFKPVPIPIGKFAEDTSLEVSKAKPSRYLLPLSSVEDDSSASDEKRKFLYKTAEGLKIKNTEEPKDSISEESIEVTPTEQDASESYRYPDRNVYLPSYRPPGSFRGAPVPIRVEPQPRPAIRPHPQLHLQPHPQQQLEPQQQQEAAESKPQQQAPPAPDDRTEFRMHGMKGPHSYQFGYDTGKGKNRQFRYEERDNDGLVHGHYGYVDRHGKLRVVNYSAHPEHGFQAQPQENQE